MPDFLLNPADNLDAVVIGGGVSGLTAALRLQNAGRSVAVLEADDRVGGRTWTEEAHGGAIDFGGMFIGATHRASQALGQSLGMVWEQARPPGRMTYTLCGGLYRAPDGGVPEGEEFTAELKDSFHRVDDLARQVGWRAPWDSPLAHDLDQMTVATWLDRHVVHPVVRAAHDVDISTMLGADPSEISMLYWAYFVAQAEGLDGLQVTANTSLWLGGAGELTRRMAERLGDRVVLSAPVTSITYDAHGVIASWAGGEVRAKSAVIAMPPSSAGLIRFSPMLDPIRTQLQAKAPIGRMTKIQVRYPERFWVEDGFSGEMLDDRIGLTALDGTRTSDEAATLIGFVGGGNRDRWIALPEAERRNRFLRLLSDAFGPKAADPLAYYETHWPEQEWQRGGPVTYMPPGVLSRFGQSLRDPIGPIHFAGTEASLEWSGYMEGAVRAGERAADTVIGAMA